ncbi:DegT/DnrJ/EryC1/StrS family aminotransferase [Pararhodospirillum photometricum]|uniref:DegT/DnrJ/EryC1/StrS family aminotransferase n=1 Tax=Pararhodospirillum photometricum TaxID=1084 RepID=UPI0012FEB583|nr:DegT/DnrJ/EryC1/StrS family aminotransferase [Pararhodospirillum photometricum]
MQQNNIQLFVPSFRVQECLDEIQVCFEKGWTGLGFKTVEFEEAWNKYTGHNHSHFLSSATAGLHLSIKIFKEVYGWEDGDEVISTPITFVSTNHAIRYERLKPVFCDIDQYFCIDPNKLEEKITNKTRAVIFVGLGGSTGQLEEVIAICKRRNIKLILDAAHMAGTRLNGKAPGNLADVTVYSFQAVKNLPTADSGMICFKDPALDVIVRQQAWLGIDKDTFSRSSEGGAYKWLYSVPYLGYKYHGNSIMAAIGLVQLRYLDQDNAYRRQIAYWYDKAFENNPRISRIPMPVGCDSSRHLYQILIDNRDEMMLALNSQGIYPGVHYRDNTEYEMYADCGDCPHAAEVSRHVISLPMHLRLDYADVQRVVEAVTRAVK